LLRPYGLLSWFLVEKIHVRSGNRVAINVGSGLYYDRSRRITLGADKAFDTKDFVRAARQMKVTVRATRNDKKRRSNLDRRTTRHVGYAISLSRRWLVEKGFG
jgi:hypothetical protein